MGGGSLVLATWYISAEMEPNFMLFQVTYMHPILKVFDMIHVPGGEVFNANGMIKDFHPNMLYERNQIGLDDSVAFTLLDMWWWKEHSQKIHLIYQALRDEGKESKNAWSNGEVEY